MKRIFALLIFAAVPALGQNTPPAYAAYINPGSGWAAWAATLGSQGIVSTPPSIALYCNAGSGWQPCNPGSGSPTGTAGGDLNGTYPNPTVSGAHITSGSIDGAVIGGTNPVAGTFTTVSATTAISSPILTLSGTGCGAGTYAKADGTGCGTPSGASLAFPETVSGTTTSGGIPYFSSTTALTSSALLALNHILLGGGAGGAPTSDANLDDGATTANTLTYAGSGGLALTGTTHGITIPAGTAVSGAAGKAIYASDATNGYAEVNENNTGLSRLCTAANGICAAGTPAYPLTVTGAVSGGVVYGNLTTQLTVSPAGTANVLMKWGGAGAAPGSSSITDNGTTATTTDIGGYVAPVFVANGTTAGFADYPQGSDSGSVAPCNTATSICEEAPTSVTSYKVIKHGAAATGFLLHTNSSSVETETVTPVEGTISTGPALFGSSAVNTVVAQTIAVAAGHFTNLVITSSLGGSCTTAPTFNVFDGTTNTGTAKLATATTQTKGTATSQTQTQTFAAGDLIGIYISTAGSACTTDTWVVSAEYSTP